MTTLILQNLYHNMMINASAAFYYLDLHAGSSSHWQEPPSYTENVDEFGEETTTIRRKFWMMEESKAYDAKNMDLTNVQFATRYSRHHKSIIVM